MVARHRAGFSLMEMMVTVAIIGVISMIAYPVGQKVHERNQVNSAARTLRGDLLDARNRATAGGTQNGVVVNRASLAFSDDANGNTFYTVTADNTDAAPAMAFQRERRDFGNKVTIQLTGNPQNIVFNRSGRTAAARTLVIVGTGLDADDPARQRTVTVSVVGLTEVN